MLKNSLWNTIGNIYYYFAQWLMTILVVHLAGYTEAGYLSMAMSVSSTCLGIANFSMRNYQITDVTGEYSDDEYIGSRVLTCLVAVTVCLIISIFYGNVYQILCINLFMMIRVIEAFSDVFQGIDQKFNRYDYIGISLIIRGTLLVFVFSLITYFANLGWALVAVTFCESIVVICWDNKKVIQLEGRKVKPVLLNNHILQLLKICAPLVLFNFLLAAENMLSKAEIQRLLGTKILGVYSSIASPTLVVQVFATVAFAPFLPLLSREIVKNNYSSLRRMINRLYFILIISAVIIYIGAFVAGKPILVLLFKRDILDYYELLMPIIVVTSLNAIIMIISGLLIAFRKIMWMVGGIVIDFIVFILIVVPLILKHGANGASYAQIVAFAIYIPWLITLCEQELSKMKSRTV